MMVGRGLEEDLPVCLKSFDGWWRGVRREVDG